MTVSLLSFCDETIKNKNKYYSYKYYLFCPVPLPVPLPLPLEKKWLLDRKIGKYPKQFQPEKKERSLVLALIAYCITNN